MEFTPKPSQKLKIEQLDYELPEHPTLPGRGMVYGQEGRQATVYQLAAESGEKYALKVFKPRFRLPSLVGLAEKLAPFASLPGLAVCQRTMLIPQRHSDLLQKYPDLLYAALMPWINGATWHDVIAERRVLTPAQSLATARSFLDVLVDMEQEGIAHCDLSGPNVIVEGLEEESLDENAVTVALVDVEQLHAPGLKQPTELPAGSPGYAHRLAEKGLWQPEADRFAAAVMLAEMLCWCDERIREASGEESYFDPDEVQQAGERVDLLKAVLRAQWGVPVVRLFERAWQSDTLADCPTMGGWLLALQGIDNQAQQTEDPHTLLIEAGRLEGEGNLIEALTTYERALANCDAGSALQAEIQLIIADLQEKQQQQASTLAQEQEAAGLAQAEKWAGAAAVYKALLAKADDPAQREKWQEEMARCREEEELATLFDDGLAAFERQDWAAARELLTAVVTRRPEYTRQGQDAAALLARIPDQLGAAPPRSRWPIWAAGMAALVVIAMLLLLGAANGGFALFAQAATETPTMTSTNTRDVATLTLSIQTATPTFETVATPTVTPSNTPEPDVTHTSTPVDTSTPTPTATASSTATPTATNTNTPVVVARLRLIAPQHGIYQNPFTFEWQASPGETYQVRLRNVGSGHEITSDWMHASSWTVDLPGEQFGNWEWQVVARNGRVSELGTFVFDPFPNTPRGVLVGDLNGDCVVDENDLQILMNNIGFEVEEGCAGVADLNCDGIVNAADYNLLRMNWGKTCDDL